jgi:hypothetical protein
MSKDLHPKRYKSCESNKSPAFVRGVRIGAAAFGLLVATTIPLQSEPAPGLWGVWHGKTDNAEIYLCVQADPGISPDDNFAAIYTTADDQIELLDRDKNVQTIWSARNDDKVTATLSILSGGSIRLDRNAADLWSGIALASIPFAKEDGATRPCESPEFNQARAVMPPLKVTSRTLDGTAYDVLTLVDPAGDGAVATFQLPPGSDGTDNINTWLRAVLPKKAEEAPYYTCTVEALGGGRDSFWDQKILPEMISDRFIVVGDTADVYCGGPYPDTSTEWHVFDSRTGANVDTRNWIHPDAFNLLGPDAGAGPEIGDTEIETGFRDLLTQAYAATNPDESCSNFLNEVSVWNVRPSKTGLMLTPEVAHISQGCAEGLQVDYNAMEPYLTEIFPKKQK